MNLGWISRVLTLAMLFVSTSSPAQESRPDAEIPSEHDMVIDGGTGQDVLHGVPVKRLVAARIDRWVLLDWTRVIVFVAPSGPHLITLREDLRGLGRGTRAGYRLRSVVIDPRLDDLIVNGFPYGIRRIERLEPEVAQRLMGDREVEFPAETVD